MRDNPVVEQPYQALNNKNIKNFLVQSKFLTSISSISIHTINFRKDVIGVSTELFNQLKTHYVGSIF